MGELELTPARREELLDLLSDTTRLELEYPLVAKYLSAAPQLGGTTDSHDEAFELRFIHYMTEDSPTESNPYWSIVEPSISRRDGRYVVDGGAPGGSSRLAYAQMVLQDAYAYAIPSPESVNWIVERCTGMPLIECGAGRGYWARQLDRAGLQVAAYDNDVPGRVWHPVEHSVSAGLPVKAGKQHVLFLSWPPGWNDPMATEVLREFQGVGGRRLIYIGEPRGGKTANDEFFDALSARWTLQSTDPNFVSWWTNQDCAQEWVRNE